MPFDFLERFIGQNILVLGDLMLDEYLWGDARRISPEAPVQVIDIQRETLAPGGACNVAVNIVSLGGKVFLGGVVGKDSAAQCLKSELSRLNVDVAGLVEDKQRPTITKTRLVARNQQIVRYDRESRAPLSAYIRQNILDWVERVLPQVALCVFSDYAKGISTPEFMQEFIKLVVLHQKPLLVDPKGNGFQKYRGAVLITPNLQETEVATGMEIRSPDDLMAACNILRERLPGTNILVKQGPLGMTLFAGGSGGIFHVDAVARQVFDVTGAGDTVIAVFAMALASGVDWEESTRLANRAAGIVVGKVGTASVTLEELLQASIV